MQCMQAQERMWQCLDQKNVRDIRLQQHLDICRRCACMWQDMNQFQQELDELKFAQPSADFVERVMEAAKGEALDQLSSRLLKQKWATWNHLWIASASTLLLLWIDGNIVTEEASGLPVIAFYALKFGWAITEMAGYIPKLF